MEECQTKVNDYIFCLFSSEPSIPVEEPPSQTIILEPKVIAQPILYSIVGAKNLPPQSKQLA